MYLKSLGIFVLGVTLVGCGGPSQFEGATKDSDLYENTETAVGLGSDGRVDIASRLAIIEKKASMSDDGRVQVQAKILNKSNQVARAMVQTVFKDESGYPVDETNFELIVVPAKAYHYYFAESLNDKARSYVVRMKWPDK